MDNVWIGGNGGTDSHVLKFTRAGEFLPQVGEHDHEGPDSLSTTRYSQVAKVRYDPAAKEVYIAEGMATGAWRWSMPTPVS
ncbi:MAG: hypothetical protein Ct9H300mP25_13590 [Acidobacteriota bacterium]|nr:MAG: hypothetical protein Ct9H300mP25_13590 [Acidobacteriota bacterium]